MYKFSSPLQNLLWGILVLINTAVGLFMFGLAFGPSFNLDSRIGQWLTPIHSEDLPISEGQTVALVFAIAIFYLIIRAIYYAVVERDRRQYYQQWAKQNRWAYFPQKDAVFCEQYRFLLGIPGSCSSPSPRTSITAIHRFQRQWRNYQAITYTHYVHSIKTYRSGKSRRTKVSHTYLGITLIKTQHNFPKLYLAPTHWSDPILAGIGYPFKLLYLQLGFKFEKLPYQEFKLLPSQLHNHQQLKKYRIQTTDPRFARQFFHPKMLKYLTTLPKGTEFEIDRDVLVIFQKGRLRLEQIEQNLAYLHDIYQLTPK